MEDKEQPRTRNRQACHHMVKQQEISLIACIAQNGAIGFHNHLLYPIMQDMQRFKTLTTGHTVIMGRMTYLSLPNGPLPNRRNIIVSKTMRKEQSAEMTSANEAESKNRELSHASALQYEVCRSLEEALSRCRDQGEKEVFIIGGAMLYRSAPQSCHSSVPHHRRRYATTGRCLLSSHSQRGGMLKPSRMEESEGGDT